MLRGQCADISASGTALDLPVTRATRNYHRWQEMLLQVRPAHITTIQLYVVAMVIDIGIHDNDTQIDYSDYVYGLVYKSDL